MVVALNSVEQNLEILLAHCHDTLVALKPLLTREQKLG